MSLLETLIWKHSAWNLKEQYFFKTEFILSNQIMERLEGISLKNINLFLVVYM